MYEIFPDEVLGSGQFGIVYGGEYLDSGTNFNLSGFANITKIDIIITEGRLRIFNHVL